MPKVVIIDYCADAKNGRLGEDKVIMTCEVLVGDSLSLVTCLYKNIAIDLAILRFFVAQWIERQQGVL